MAKLNVYFVADHCDGCDWCQKRDGKTLVLSVNMREGRHLITVHKECLMRRIAKAELQYEAEHAEVTA